MKKRCQIARKKKLMRYDFDKVIDRNHSWSIKHDFKEENKKPEDIIPLWVADMDFVSPECVVNALKAAASHQVFGYTRPREEYFEALSGWYERRFRWKIEKEWLVKTPGVVFALSVALRAFTGPGDAVIIQPPVYEPFRRAIIRNKRKLVKNPLVLENGRYHMDLEDLERKILENHVKLMIFSSPHNPIGRVWSREELTALSQICNRHHVFVISDEIHGDFTWPGHVQIPYASLSQECAMNSMVCTAPSKTFNLAGLQTSNILIPNGQMRKCLEDELMDMGQENINRMGLIACEAAYRGGEEWLVELLTYLQGNLALIREFLEKEMPEIKLIEPEGTYLAWLDCRGMGMTEEEMVTFFSDQAKVWLDPGSHSGEEAAGFMRFNMASPRSVIERALRQIKEAWDARRA